MEDDALKLELVRNLYLGAEAELSLCTWLGYDVVVKRRRSKGYRRGELDKRIIAARTAHEALMLSRARGLGVPTPIVLHVNPVEGLIVMQYIKGPTMSQLALRAPLSELGPLFGQIGRYLALLHGNGIVHGDPTTSNMILRGKEVYIVDFGLASPAGDVEQMGEDLYVLHMALRSAHPARSVELFGRFSSGYEEELGAASSAIMKRLGEISKRGRYVERVS
jgi:TP53 regulating kinase-like protein